ncbi:MAG: hypothetical protein ACJ73N_10815 [Bryobacteraceae bacterium]
MNRVEELQRSIQELTPDEFAQIARHVHALEQEHWDHQLDQDAAAGQLDFWLKKPQRASAQVS